MSEAQGPRVFTFDEARALLPVVKRKTAEARERLSALELAADEDEEPDDDAAGEIRERASTILGEWAAEMVKLGLEVKGPWLVDFDSGAGFYCWKWPEESLEFFHGYEEGFGGRMWIQ
jgi:hypothetical protein